MLRKGGREHEKEHKKGREGERKRRRKRKEREYENKNTVLISRSESENKKDIRLVRNYSRAGSPKITSGLLTNWVSHIENIRLH